MGSNQFSRLVKILSGTVGSAEEEIFHLESRLERFVHFWALVIRQFVRHRCLVRASALSYATLLALIPLLAVAIGITSSLLKNQDVEQFQTVVEKFVAAITPPATMGTNAVAANTNIVIVVTTNAPAPEISGTNEIATSATNAAVSAPPAAGVVNVSAQKEIARQIWSFVQNTRSGTLGTTGGILLLFVAISLLARIEETFNDIWGVTRGRSQLHQIQLYCTIILLGPLLFATALGLAGGAQFQAAKDFVAQTPIVGQLIFELLPVLVLWLAFALVYQLVPNTKVRFGAALAGGAVAGTLWYLNNVFGFLCVSRVFTNSKIYGSLGLVPVFMIGLYFSWLILLFGAQVAYAFQNRTAYLQDRLADNVNQRGREFVALRLMTALGQRFQNAQRPATVIEISAELGIPSRLTQSVLRTLASARLVTEVTGAETAYLPARPLDAINAYDILRAMRTGNGQELPLSAEPALAGIYGEFARIEQAERETASAITVFALVNRTAFRAALPELAAAEKTITITPVELISGTPVELVETPAPEITSRRQTVMPDEDRDFPL